MSGQTGDIDSIARKIICHVENLVSTSNLNKRGQ